MRNSFVNLLLHKAKQDDRIILLTGDLGYGVVDDFAKVLPRQFINFGINEQSMMSAAAGLASKGFKPFVYSIGNFPTFRCLEQIRNDVCYMNLDVTIVALGAGFAYGTAGYSHHLVEDISAISPLANIRIFSPADTYETELVIELLASTPGPKYIRLGKGGEGELTSNFSHEFSGLSLLPGSNETLILSTGNVLAEALTAREILKESKPTIASCYDLMQLKNYIPSINYSKIVTIEEHVARGGFGSIVREILGKTTSDFSSIAIEKIDPGISGSQKFLRAQYGITYNQLIRHLT